VARCFCSWAPPPGVDPPIRRIHRAPARIIEELNQPFFLASIKILCYNLLVMQDLILLGLLKEGPKHGYEIRKTIEQVLSSFANVDSTSIYYPLRRLEKKGLVTKKLGRKGKRPAKFIYKITKEGEEVFERLLNNNFLTFQRPIFNIDISLYFLPLVKSGIAQTRLRSRLRGMKKIMHWLKERRTELEKERKSRHLLVIIEHQIELTKADIRFTKKLIANYKSNK
jgi:DNA-binding PadR family transcriptional regulator